MCMSCGCMNPETEKKDQITIQDLRRAAEAQDTTVDEVVNNINRTYQRAART